MDEVMRIANAHNLIVVEDAAQAFLSQHRGRYAGTIGHLGCFSFHYTKNVIAGEGGALCINDPRFIDRAMIAWEKGTNRFDFVQGKVDKYYWIDLGSSFVPNEMMSAFLLGQLVEARAVCEKRAKICTIYKAELSRLTGPHFSHMGYGSNGHIFWIVLSEGLSRQKVMAELKDVGVQCFSHYVPLHSSAGGEKFGRVHGTMGVSERAGERLIRLPVWYEMTWQHVFKVVKSIYEVLRMEPPPFHNVLHAFYDI